MSLIESRYTMARVRFFPMPFLSELTGMTLVMEPVADAPDNTACLPSDANDWVVDAIFAVNRTVGGIRIGTGEMINVIGLEAFPVLPTAIALATGWWFGANRPDHPVR